MCSNGYKLSNNLNKTQIKLSCINLTVHWNNLQYGVFNQPKTSKDERGWEHGNVIGSKQEQLLVVPESVSHGELLFFWGYGAMWSPDAMLKSKGPMKVWDRVQVRLGVNENGEATYLTRIVIPSLEKY